MYSEPCTQGTLYPALYLLRWCWERRGPGGGRCHAVRGDWRGQGVEGGTLLTSVERGGDGLDGESGSVRGEEQGPAIPARPSMKPAPAPPGHEFLAFRAGLQHDKSGERVAHADRGDGREYVGEVQAADFLGVEVGTERQHQGVEGGGLHIGPSAW